MLGVAVEALILIKFALIPSRPCGGKVDTLEFAAAHALTAPPAGLH
jgi:hypothetical protein